ncbi:acylphosphatase [Streptomyces sp. SB3404]|uniref:acylphosphatase n=2 Tax=Streptomyces boncukensis TaxID=2711219 RepID=A0A6G4X103_9ACTN|nr:acylphosphatase [Streptomyces boncukensis]NGO70933.1 acylphosphatase [Streptomyces boncukensis]
MEISDAKDVPVIRRRVLAEGDVQGVFYRDTCRDQAVRHGVRGWVRNLPDGSTVEAVFEGEPDAVARLVEWAGEGSPAAFVDELRVFEEEPRGAEGFTVRPTPPRPS